MKILLRVISLPLAWVLWTIHYSYYWVRYGGELIIKDKPLIKPEEFHRLLTEVSERLKDFEAQKDETLHWKRLYENYDLDHCATFVGQEEGFSEAMDAWEKQRIELRDLGEKLFEENISLKKELQDYKSLLDLERSSRKMDRTLAVSQVAVGLSKVDELIEENVKLKQEVADNAFKCLQLKKQIKEVTQKQVDDYCKSIETEQGLTTNNYPVKGKGDYSRIIVDVNSIGNFINNLK